MNSSKIIGNFDYKTIHTKQVNNIKEYFEPFLIDEKFDDIIEIGTALGGLTLILHDIIKDNSLNAKIWTFDIVDIAFNGIKDIDIIYFEKLDSAFPVFLLRR